MMKIRQRKMTFLLLALLLVFAACKGESPTAPNPSGGGTTPPSGGVTPPVGATIVLTVSNPTPLAASTSTITATVTLNGSPVVNGTAVEFATDFGSFSLSDPNVVSVIKTTTNGVASVTLTAPSPGTANVTAVVNNVSKQTQVKFQAQPVPPILPPSTAPTITSIAPTVGRPAGGEQVTITGTNFRTPVRVIFDFGGGVTKDAFVVTVTPTQIVALTPPIDVGIAQQKQATITVINEAGTPNEVKVSSAANAFTFQAEVLTPSITTISPTSGPIDGGTRVTIFGDGFQAPVQVFFGVQDAQVISITFKQLVVMSPTARDTSPNGSGVVTGPVDVKVININSNKTATSTGAFRYTPKMQITAISPTFGGAFGGTQVRIDGVGFTSPVTVDIAGVRAQTLSVSGTEIVAQTAPLPSPCTGTSGPIVVTNVDNGDLATSTGLPFQYVAVPPVITSVTPATGITFGGSVTVTVLNPGVGQLGTAFVAMSIGDKPAAVSPSQISTGTGSQSFSVIVPNTLTLPTVSCTSNGLTGTQFGPAVFPVTFTNLTTSCTTTLLNAITIQPPGPNNCVTPPGASVTFPPGGGCVTQTSPVGVATTVNGTITIANIAGLGGQTLTVTNPTISGTNSADYSIAPSSASIAPGASANFTVTFKPVAPPSTPRSGTVTFTTNDPAKSTITVCLTGTGT